MPLIAEATWWKIGNTTIWADAKVGVWSWGSSNGLIATLQNTYTRTITFKPETGSLIIPLLAPPQEEEC
jgi:hypothetical protein